MNTSSNRLVVIFGFIFLAAFSRLIPHPYNLSPIGGLALFSGATLWDKKVWAFIVPILSLFLSDLVLGMHSTMPYVYGAVILMVLIGKAFSANAKVSSLIQMSLLSSILFFLVTNFGYWATTPALPRTGAGLMAAYISAIPFFHWTVIGDLVFVLGMFGAYRRFFLTNGVVSNSENRAFL